MSIRAKAAGLVAAVALLALGFLLGWTEHRSSHHITRLDAGYIECEGIHAQHPTWGYATGKQTLFGKAGLAACALDHSR